MGNYVFTTADLIEALRIDAGDEGSVHDMGGNLVPMLVKEGAAQVYDFADNDVPGSTDRDRGYWRDVGTLDAYYDAHMDLVSIHPVFNLYNRQWPILTSQPSLPPAKFVEGGGAHESTVGAGTIVSGGHVVVVRALQRRHHRAGRLRRGLGAHARRPHRARARSSAGPSSTRTSSSPTGPASASTSSATASSTR